jgi:peptidase E
MNTSMATKLILHGGFSKDRGPVQEDDEFFREIFKDTEEEVKLLGVYFAEREEMLQLRMEHDQVQFTKNSDSKKIDFRVASEKTFEADCAWADIIYLHGGHTAKLMEALKKYSNIKELLSTRIIAGDSAGANVLAKFFYSKNSKVIGEGLGILPFKLVVHYEKGTPNPLGEIEPELETVFLQEYETKVFYLD